MISLPCASPPSTLSAPTWPSTPGTPSTRRSMVTTGIPASTAACTAGCIATASSGLMMMPSTPWVTAASTSAVCLVVWFWPSVSISVMPPISVALSAQRLLHVHEERELQRRQRPGRASAPCPAPAPGRSPPRARSPRSPGISTFVGSIFIEFPPDHLPGQSAVARSCFLRSLRPSRRKPAPACGERTLVRGRPAGQCDVIADAVSRASVERPARGLPPALRRRRRSRRPVRRIDQRQPRAGHAARRRRVEARPRPPPAAAARAPREARDAAPAGSSGYQTSTVASGHFATSRRTKPPPPHTPPLPRRRGRPAPARAAA